VAEIVLRVGVGFSIRQAQDLDPEQVVGPTDALSPVWKPATTSIGASSPSHLAELAPLNLTVIVFKKHFAVALV